MAENEWRKLVPDETRGYPAYYRHHAGCVQPHRLDWTMSITEAPHAGYLGQGLTDAEALAFALLLPKVAAFVDAVKDVLEYADTSGGEFDYLEQTLAALDTDTHGKEEESESA